MLIDFAEEHGRFLKGRNDNGTWVFNPVNATNPIAGIHLSSYQVFSNAGLGIALYLRNETNEAGQAVKVHAGLKMLFSHKERNRYLLAKDQQRIALTLDIGAVRFLYAWLRGSKPSFTYDLVRSGTAPRQISGYETDRSFPLTIRATEFSPSDGHRSIDVGLSHDDIFHIEMHCIALAKLLYPSISDVAIAQHLVPRERSQSRMSGQADEEGGHLTRSTPNLPRDQEPQGGPSTSTVVDLERARKAIFAVGKKKWIGDIETILFIQENAPLEVMDRLIKAGNDQDFSEWNRMHELVKSGTFQF